VAPRFLKIADVADELSITVAQVRALLASGELRGIQVGGKGAWRVEVTELEAYIQRRYAEADAARAERAASTDSVKR
jgi:excisionase family DNA binding protein